MLVIGLDPGTNESAFVIYDGERVTDMEIAPNAEILGWMKGCRPRKGEAWAPLAIEQFESFGMAVGREVFQTVFWSGRFAEAYADGTHFAQVTRRTVKLHLCFSARATDANIRTALIDRFGGPEKAVGTKKAPGPLFGVKSHLWAALAIAVTYYDQHAGQPEQVRPGVVPQWSEEKKGDADF